MTRVTDEMLMAYADGALSEAEAAAVERLLRDGDPEARAAVEEFRRTAALVRAAYADEAAEPVPADLVRTVLGHAPARKPPGLSRLRRARASAAPYALALAASLVAVLAVGSLWFSLAPPQAVVADALRIGPVEAGSRLANVLAKVPSGTPVEASTSASGGDAQLMVVGTFYDRHERICREVELMDRALAPQQVAVACRAPEDGRWSVEGIARIAAAPDATSGSYAPAGAPEKEALQGLMQALGAGDALSADDERRLIERGWQK